MNFLKATLLCLLLQVTVYAQSEKQSGLPSEVEKLTNALRAETKIFEDLHELCDQIGGRVTGTRANETSVQWALAKFKKYGVEAWKEPFEMPRKWNERSANAQVRGSANWKPRVACRAFSVGTPEDGLEAELLFAGKGTRKEFEILGDKVEGNFVLIETNVMTDLTKLFLEYINAVEIEYNAKQAGALGVVYMSSREKKLLYRHLTSFGTENDMPMVVMARDDATRCMRLLKRGKRLQLNLQLDVLDEGPYTTNNVIAEIPGKSFPEEVIVLGAHLDSWGLGTGANDNGCNVNMLIDIARQMTALKIRGERTIRFALWNGEEQGMLGSRAYVEAHREDSEELVMGISIDIGSGNIDGFFVNGREEITPYLERYLTGLEEFGPYEHPSGGIVGTDNYDFLANGISNLVGKHDVHNYCDDYHSESDTFDKVNQKNMKGNSVIVASVVLGLANEIIWPFPRQNREDVQEIIEKYDLQSGMKALRLWNEWLAGTRGLKL